MKKFLFFSALAALLLSTAACSSDEPAAQGDDTVTFTVNLQNGNDSRAISDGTKAVNLTAFAYKDGKKVQQQTATFSGLKATVTFKLVKGVKYDFSFWAQSPDAKCYTLSADGKKVSIDYTQAASNVDNDDAFYGVKKDVTVGTSASDETVTIYRPFAQLNYGDNLDDYEAAKEAGTEVTKTLVTVKNAANVLDLTTGQASGDVAVTYALAPVPSESKELVVDRTNYKWLAMNYLLVPGQVRMADTKITTESGLVTTTLTVYAGETKLNEMSVANVPVQSNHRTNILGNLLTDKVNFNVVIDPVFDNPDYNVNVPAWDGATLTEPKLLDGVYQVSKAAEWAWIVNNVNTGNIGRKGISIALTSDIDFAGHNYTPFHLNLVSPTLELDGNGHKFMNANIVPLPGGLGYTSGLFCGDALACDINVHDINFSNINVTNESADGGYVGVVIGDVQNSRTLTLTNVKATNCTIKGVRSDAVLVGYVAKGCTVDATNCHVSKCNVSNVTLANKKSGYVAGMIGRPAGKVTLTDCSVTGTTINGIWNTDDYGAASIDAIVGDREGGKLNANITLNGTTESGNTVKVNKAEL